MGRKSGFRPRYDESTFELNLAPMLDIIVSIVPMLLMSVVFVRITVVETQVPQIVKQAIQAANEKNKDQIQIRLSIEKNRDLHFTVSENGVSNAAMGLVIANKSTRVDLETLYGQVLKLKGQHPDVFKAELNPDESLPLSELVEVLDTVRSTRGGAKSVVFKDVQSGRDIETNLLLPDVIFGNVTGG